MKLGFPRALSYYDYYPFWAGFFSTLGIELEVSPPTQREIMTLGLKMAPEETCLPIKILVGHLNAFGSVDGIFLPRLVSMEEDTYLCPKILGIPESILAAVPQGTKVYSVDINWKKGERSVLRNLEGLAKQLGVAPIDVRKGLARAQQMQRQFHRLREQGVGFEESVRRLEGWLKPSWDRSLRPRSYRFDLKPFNYKPFNLKPFLPEKDKRIPGIALLGHSYLIYEHFGNLNLLRRLEKNCHLYLVEKIPQEQIEAKQENLAKRLFWSHAKKIYGAGDTYIEDPAIDGVIYLSCFGCGTDSMTNELLARRARKAQKPFMTITLDEHSGEAGLVTRLEAFLDMLERRHDNESNISPHGGLLDRHSSLI